MRRKGHSARQGAEAVIILARIGHVIGIEGRNTRRRGVLLDPRKGLQPWIVRTRRRKLKMRHVGEQLPLRGEHAAIGRQQKTASAMLFS